MATATNLRAPKSDFEDEPASLAQQIIVGVFVGVPMLALVAAIPFAWGWGLGWHDVVIAAFFYWLTGLGITVGYHRYFTHGSFKAKTPLRVALAVAGTMAMQGPVITWVSDHRKHHKYSDREGDPHSPWRYGTTPRPWPRDWSTRTCSGCSTRTRPRRRSSPPTCWPTRTSRRVDKLFAPLVGVSLLGPALIGGLWGMSWHGAITAFFWAGLVRITLLHHVTWSINSICHTFGNKEWESRDKSRNVSWLAIASFGESWHNLHHVGPDLRPARRAQGPDRPVRPGDPVVRAARLGLRRPLAGRGQARVQAPGQRDAQSRLDDQAQRQNGNPCRQGGGITR